MRMPLPKLTVVGAGNVGASLAQRLVESDLGDVVLVDIVEGLARGKALDLDQAGAIRGYTARVTGTSRYEDTAGSDLVLVTSGSPRKPGMSRDDLLKINFEIVRSVVSQAAHHSPQAIILLVTNPLDAMVHTALAASGFPRERVVGMAGVLDSARFRTFLAEALKVSPAGIEAMVLGGHGDEMVPCLTLTRVAGTPVTDWLAPEKLEAVVARTRAGGAEIVKLLQTGSAFYAPAAAAARMAAAILRDEKAVLPCAVRLEGEYGFSGQVLGVPVVLGRGGAERVVSVALTPAEREDLARSARSVAALCAQIDGWMKNGAS
jgi:malate dehydrogenase